MSQINKPDKIKIIAPVCSLSEIKQVIDAGANEIYFGMMPKNWQCKYGDADFISRRQTEYAHFKEIDSMPEIIELTAEKQCEATLVLNSKYSETQLPYILDLINKWENFGGQSVMISDLAVLISLFENKSKLTRRLSILTGVYNSESVAFFKEFGISSIVLPRELSIQEMIEIRNKIQDIDFEVITIFQKCQFIDGFCGFYHGFNYQPFIIKQNITNLCTELYPPLYTFDAAYEGHGCQLKWSINEDKEVIHLTKNEINTPHCAGCQLKKLFNNGITRFKIAGRAYPLQLILNAIKFIKIIFDSFECLSKLEIRKLYKSIFGQDCECKYCYYD